MVIFLWAFEIAEQQRGTVWGPLERRKMEEFKMSCLDKVSKKINSIFSITHRRSITYISKALTDQSKIAYWPKINR